MANQFTSTTFLDTYKDDFADSDGYHKVLFNSGRALQGRELNQLQTILQTQITRMASNIFMDGAAISPKSSGAGTDIVDYVLVDSLPNSAEDYIGATFRGPSGTGTSGLLFQVSYVAPAANGDEATLYGRYVSNNQASVSSDVQTTQPVFGKGDSLVEVTGNLTSLSVLNNSLLSSTGKGVLFSMQQAEFFVQGHFVYAPKQTLAISKYEQFVDCEVGFEIVQDVVTVADDVNLYDNQGARPNLSSPGADRYRIRMVLTTRDIIADEADFCPFATVRRSKIVQIKEGTDNFNQVEKRMARRHADTHGNFIVNDFEIQFREGDDSANIILDVPANSLGVRPLAFLDGYHLEHKIPISANLPKPVSFRSLDNQGINAEYRNYLTFKDSTGTGNIGFLENLTINNQERLALLNGAGTVIGNARVKSITNRDLIGTGDSDAVRMYLYDIAMKPSQNFRDVRSLRTANDATSNVVKPELRDTLGNDNGGLYLTDPSINTNLFRIPGGRVKFVDVTSMTVQRQNDQTCDGSSQLTITCGADEELTDTGQWLFINKTTNAVEEISTSNIVLNGTATTATVTTAGTASTDQYTVFYYVRLTDPAPITKRYREDWFDAVRVQGDSAIYGADKFEVPGISGGKLFDGIALIEAFDSDSAGSNLLTSLEFDNGQRDNYYGPVVLRPEGTQVSQSVSTVRCKIGYMEWIGTGDFISVNSYDLNDSTWFGYGDIPDYVSRQSGGAYALHNFLDFRPQLDPQDVTSTGIRFDMPRDGDNILYDAEFYNARVDQLVLTYDDQYKTKLIINRGEEAEQPVPPNEKPNQMVLFDILLNGNTKSVDDVAINRRTYRGFKMQDINDIEKRIGRLEETVSLSFLEQEASNLVELDANGVVRSKTGFFVDDFTKGVAFTALAKTNEFIDDASFHSSSFDDQVFTIHAKMDAENLSLAYDSSNSYGANSRTTNTKSNMRRKGDLLMLDYTHVLDDTMKQEMISWRPGQSNEEHGYYNVNPFNVFMSEGTLRLNPSRDVWFDTRRLPDKHTQGQTIIRKVGEPVIPRTWTFTRTSVTSRWVTDSRVTGNQRNVIQDAIMRLLGRDVPQRRVRFQQRLGRATTTTTETFRVTQSVRTRVVSDQTFTTNLGDKTVAILSVPFMRQRRIMAKGEGLRPNTRYWCYFNGIRMDQWTRKRTDTEFATGIAAGVHTVPVPPRDVNLIRHPDVTSPATDQVLLTNSDGEVFFELWIPNNAVIPVPGSSTFSTEEEWAAWIAKNRGEVKKYGSSRSPEVWDRCGWKFRCGTAEIKLLDVSEYTAQPLSSAKTTYSAWGDIHLRQTTLETTRVITVQDELVERTDLIGTSTSTNVNWGDWRPRDPLAQTFTVDADLGVPGVFVTKVDVFLRTAPSGEVGTVDTSIQLQIRNVDAGVPERDAISEQHTKYVTASQVRTNISSVDMENYAEVMLAPTTFEFDEPVFLRAGEEYAIVLMAETDAYTAFVASTYDLVLGSTSKRVNKQPAKGSLFLSQNGSTWTPKQNQDLAYRIYTAKFKTEGAANFVGQPLERHLHNYATSLSVDSADLNRMRIDHPAHGLGVGDKIALTGLDSGSTYHGVAGTALMATTLKVEDPDVNGYYTTISGPFTSRGRFGATTVKTNRAFNVDRAILNFTDMVPERTTINYDASFVSGVSYANISTTGTNDPRFQVDTNNTILGNKLQHYFNSPKFVASATHEDSVGEASVLIGAAFATEQTSKFGSADAVTAASSGYIADVSPLIDLQTMSVILQNNIIDNQPLDSAGQAGGSVNAPANYVSETHPTAGTSASKHITKIVQVEQPANGLKVLLDMYKPPAASFQLYYRTAVAGDDDLYDFEWIAVSPENDPPDATVAYSDDDISFAGYRYLIGGEEGTLPDFTAFQLKVVFKSTNTAQSPILDNIRAIALI
jgi:hypothetical protein